MKKHLNIKTILIICSVLVVIAGAMAIYTSGFEKSIEYNAGKRIEVNIPNGYYKKDIIDIAKESFETDEIMFSEIEKTNQVAGIKISQYSDKQLDNFINKVAEKYKINSEDMQYHEVIIPEININTIINPYILPVAVTTFISLIYIIIKNYRSNNKTKIALKVLGILVITLCLYFSIIALFKLSFSIYTMPLAFAIYIVTLLISVNKKCE